LRNPLLHEKVRVRVHLNAVLGTHVVEWTSRHPVLHSATRRFAVAVRLRLTLASQTVALAIRNRFAHALRKQIAIALDCLALGIIHDAIPRHCKLCLNHLLLLRLLALAARLAISLGDIHLFHTHKPSCLIDRKPVLLRQRSDCSQSNILRKGSHRAFQSRSHRKASHVFCVFELCVALKTRIDSLDG